MFPFTKNHVKSIWCVSQRARSERLKETASTTRKQREELLAAFSRDILAGRSDETLGFDPRSYGNEESPVNLPDEVLRLFLSRASTKDPFGTLIIWEYG